MNILVTGGGGYLGSVLVQMLLEFPNKVTVVDTFGHKIDSLAHLVRNRNLTIIRGDVRYGVKDYLSDIDAVVPLAALVGAPICNSHADLAIALNTTQIDNFVKAMSPNQILIYPCTNSGYGLGGETLCTETSPLRPLTAYGMTKVEGEKIALSHPRSVSLRFATLFGVSPRMRLDLLVNDLVHEAVTNGIIELYQQNFRRNFLHVRDAAVAIFHAIGGNLRWQESYNAGNTEANMTKLQLAELIKVVLPQTKITSRSGNDPDKRDYLVSNAKLEHTGWRPITTIATGINELVRAYRGMPFTNPGYRNAD